jgi:hypothetical protein
VYDCFNASIPHPRQKDQTRNGWHGSSLSVGDHVKFRVTNVEHARGIISIRGALLDDRTSYTEFDENKQTQGNGSETDVIAGIPNTGRKLKLKKLTKVKLGIDQECQPITTNAIHLESDNEVMQTINETVNNSGLESVKRPSSEGKVRRTKSVWAGVMGSPEVHASDKHVRDRTSESQKILNWDLPKKKKRTNSVLDTATISCTDCIIDDQPPKKKQKIRHKSK